MELRFEEAMENRSANKGVKFPGKTDPRCRDGGLFPSFADFGEIRTPCQVFTIGSCFARNIEEALDPAKTILPTRRIAVPREEGTQRPNGILNEYNPGTISQRILWALGEGRRPEETLVEVEEGCVDLLLSNAFVPVAREKALRRRAEVDAVYADLARSDLVIITLGMVECWFDARLGCYLNRMPPAAVEARDRGRYLFRRLDAGAAAALLGKALGALCAASACRIILTVSPVPFNTTFTRDDAVVANSYSKAALRVCIETLRGEFPRIEYFPSYEIVASHGLAGFTEDNIHVKDKIVRLLTREMAGSLFSESRPLPPAKLKSVAAGVAAGPGKVSLARKLARKAKGAIRRIIGR